MCRRWRNVGFHSPRRLNLRLSQDGASIDNTIAALGHNDRVCQIKLSSYKISSPEFTNSAAVQKPLPELTHLWLYRFVQSILLDSLLGGTAPRLRSLVLYDVPFPGLPKLLSQPLTSSILNSHIFPVLGTYHRGDGRQPLCIDQPRVTCPSISILTTSPCHRRLTSTCEPQLTHSILPGLTWILFKGANKYLEEIFARIDAPRHYIRLLL